MAVKRISVSLFSTLALAGISAAADTPQLDGPIVQLASGRVRGGADDKGIISFKGIPYAAPPVGELRWRSPQPAPEWQGIRDGGQYGARCVSPAGGPFTADGVTSEDCLTANVWTQADFAHAKRPVMVWIHGGGFQLGSSQEANTDGTRFAAKGVVIVSFNYRLGVLGFLSHPELDTEGQPSGNYGLQDQVQALRWVKTNISQFGGDPTNVTIFGESAGAMSIGLLMASPLAHGLFSKAIGESGAFWDSEHGSISTRDEAQARGRALAQKLGGGTIKGLRAVPAEQLVAATQNMRADPVTTAFSPSIDGYVLAVTPAAAYLQAQQMKVPLLAGYNGAEDFIFRDRALPHQNAAEFKSAAAAFFGADHVAEFLTLYPADSDAAAANSANALIGDLAIAEQVWAWLQLHRRTGGASVFGYEFRYHSAYSPLPIHGAEIDFVFGTLLPKRMAPSGTLPDARDREIAEQMMSYWVNFARSSNPNGAGVPVWPAYRADTPQIMEFGPETSSKNETTTARMRFLEKFRVNGRFPERWRLAR